MKYEIIPTPQTNKTKRLATWLFICGVILFIAGGVKVIPFRFVLQLAALAALTASIMLIGRFLLRAYAYRIDDLGEGFEFFVDEITRSTRYTVCRMELSKLVSVTKWEDCGKDERAKKRYSYCPDAFGDGSYVLEFVDSAYDVTADRIRVRIAPDEKLLSILNEAVARNNETAEEN